MREIKFRAWDSGLKRIIIKLYGAKFHDDYV